MLYALLTVLREITTTQNVDIDLGINPAILQKGPNWDRFCITILSLLASKKLQPRNPILIE